MRTRRTRRAARRADATPFGDRPPGASRLVPAAGVYFVSDERPRPSVLVDPGDEQQARDRFLGRSVAEYAADGQKALGPGETVGDIVTHPEGIGEEERCFEPAVNEVEDRRIGERRRVAFEELSRVFEDAFEARAHGEVLVESMCLPPFRVLHGGIVSVFVMRSPWSLNPGTRRVTASRSSPANAVLRDHSQTMPSK